MFADVEVVSLYFGLGIFDGTADQSVFDGLIYALITGGVFGWLWPV